MTRYAVKLARVTLVIEVDATSAEDARMAVYHAFRPEVPRDPLEGTRFTLPSAETRISNPRLMTTSVQGGWISATAEEV